MKPAEKHVHKLKRLIHKSGTRVFFCVLDCSYKVSTALALGKKSICWRCGDEFFMNEYSLRLSKPHCENCHKPKGPSKEQIHEEELHESLKEAPIEVVPTAPSLFERLQQTIKQTQTVAEDEGEI